MSRLVTETVLFTDLVDSTAQLTRLGQDAYEQLRRTHFGLLRDAITAHGGIQVKNLGDGVMATFEAASGAVAAAVAIQQAAERHNRSAAAPLTSRIGIALGDVTEEDGDYFGAAVIHAARLCAAASAGQILCTDILRLMAGTRGGHRITPIGPLELKGLPDPVQAAMVEWSPAEGSGPDEAAASGTAPGVPGATTGGSPPLPSRLPPAAPFGSFGREDEELLLAQAFKRTAAGEGAEVVFICGEPGIGKSTLAADLCRAAHADGATVLYGSCDELLAGPYRPFSEALHQLVATASSEVIADHVAAYGGELASMVPELALRWPSLPVARTGDPETERYLLFQSVAGLLARASADAPIVLLVDDLQWADKASLLLLKHVATSGDPIGSSRVLVVGASRDVDRAGAPALFDLLASLRREHNVDRIGLSGLDDSAVIALLEAAAGYPMEGAEVALAHVLRKETDGNPFFMTELLRHLVESGKIHQNAGGRWVAGWGITTTGIPQSLYEVVGERVARLAGDGITVLTAAAVIGIEFDLDLLAAVTALDPEALLDLLEAAGSTALVSEVPAHPGRFRFAHTVIREALYQHAGAEQRARVHAHIATAIEEGGDRDGHLTALAHHWAEADDHESVPKAIGYARRAGEAALAGLAPDEAVRWFTQARALYRRLPSRDDSLELDLLIGLGTAQNHAGDPAHRQTLLDAASLARRRGDTRRLVAAALANGRGTFSAGGGVDAERVDALRAALDAVGTGDTAERAMLLASIAVEIEFGDEAGERLVLADQALAMARRLRQPDVLARILNFRFYAVNVPETLPDRLATTAESLRLARETGDPHLRFWAARLRVYACIQAGDIEEVDRHLADMSLLADELAQPWLQHLTLNNQAWRALLAGRVEEAEALATRSFEIALDMGSADAIPSFGGQLFVIRRHQGRLDELIDLLVRVLNENPRLVVNRAALALAYCELDRDREAAEIFATEAAREFASLPHDSLWLAGMRIWGDVCCHLGQRTAAATLYDRLAPFHDQVAVSPGAVGGSVAHTLASLAGLLGRSQDAETHYREAEAVYERIGSPWHQAALKLDEGRMLLRDGGRAAAGRRLLTDAARLASGVGNPTIERRAAALLGETGGPAG
jgi:class 3 adenylate cyclase/tetratricopeptide (TPR) repeat protein